MISRLSPISRILLVVGLLAFSLLLCGVAALFVLTRPGSNHLNPIESMILRVQLSSRDKDLKAPAGADPSPLCFSVNQGDNASSIGARLLKQGFVSDADLFRNYVRYYGIDAQLQAGVYSLKRTLTIPEIAQTLTNAGANTVTFQVIEGKRIEEIMQAIDNSNPPLAFRGEDFYQIVGPGAATRSQTVQDFATRVGLPIDKSLEGFLFPDTYILPACAKADELVSRMLTNFDTRVTVQMQADAQAHGLTLYQALTLASIVEREAVVEDERPVIASVYLNRLHKPMTLDADPTVQYALGNRRDASTWWPDITAEDYQNVKDSYNTYLNKGLPPGPIANPGLSSIQAVLKPQTTPYFYFRATCVGDGRHKFAVTLAEQQANGC
jgi:UPF0755 protein